MSIRRVFQVFAFLTALAISFSAPIAMFSSTADACGGGSAGEC